MQKEKKNKARKRIFGVSRGIICNRWVMQEVTLNQRLDRGGGEWCRELEERAKVGGVSGLASFKSRGGGGTVWSELGEGSRR